MNELASNGNPMIVKFSGAIAFRLIKKRKAEATAEELVVAAESLGQQ